VPEVEGVRQRKAGCIVHPRRGQTLMKKGRSEVSSVPMTVKAMLEQGSTLGEALAELGIGYSRWRRLCEQEGVKIIVPQGKKPTTYTRERVREVQRRVRAGEYLKDVAGDMGMDPKNLARYCRNNGIKLFTKRALKDNYRRRGENRKPGTKALAIRQKIQEGLNDAVIAKEIGASRSYVSQIRSKMAQEAKDG